MKRYLKYIVIFIIIFSLVRLYLVYSFELIDYKEQYLIKKNYRNNIEVFNSTIDDFKIFQNLSIEFDEDNYMNAFISGFQYLEEKPNDGIKFYEQYEIGQLNINDTIALLDYKNEQYEILSFKVDKSIIEIKLLSDTTITIDKYWGLNYKGYCNSDFFSETLKAMDITEVQLDYLKNQLRIRNCFGCIIDDNKIILHYRLPPLGKLLVCSYSYCILKSNDIKNDFFENNYKYGKIDANVYWFFNDAIQIVSLEPGGFKNRKI